MNFSGTVIILIFPLVLGTLMATTAWLWKKRGPLDPTVRAGIALVAAQILLYLVVFAEIAWHPQWVDNGVEQTIPFSKYWIYAIFGASLWDIVFLPVCLVILFFVFKIKKTPSN
jgi:hypothetical protein